MYVNLLIIATIGTLTPITIYVIIKHNIIQRYIGSLNFSKNKHLKTLDELRSEFIGLKEHIEINREKIELIENKLRELEQRIETLDELRSEFIGLKEHIEINREKIELIENKLRELEQRIETLDEKITSTEVENRDEDDIVIKVVDLRKKGYSLKKIAEELGISISRVRKILKDNTID